MIRTVVAAVLLSFALAVVLPRFAPEAGAQRIAQAEKKKNQAEKKKKDSYFKKGGQYKSSR